MSFGVRFISIGIESIAVAAARVVELPPRCSYKRGKNADVYKTYARIILLVTARARSEKPLVSTSLNSPELHRASSVWGIMEFSFYLFLFIFICIFYYSIPQLCVYVMLVLRCLLLSVSELGRTTVALPSCSTMGTSSCATL